MKRLALAAFLIALPFALAGAVPRAQQFPGVYRELGAFTVRYGVANGPDGRETTAEQYAAYVASGSCLPTSHVSVWRESRVVDVICEL